MAHNLVRNGVLGGGESGAQAGVGVALGDLLVSLLGGSGSGTLNGLGNVCEEEWGWSDGCIDGLEASGWREEVETGGVAQDTHS